MTLTQWGREGLVTVRVGPTDISLAKVEPQTGGALLWQPGASLEVDELAPGRNPPRAKSSLPAMFGIHSADMLISQR